MSSAMHQAGNAEIQGTAHKRRKSRESPWLLDSVHPSLKPIAWDLLAMPASQAFAERVFSVTGDLSRGRRNRARIILERSAFLQLNRSDDSATSQLFLLLSLIQLFDFHVKLHWEPTCDWWRMFYWFLFCAAKRIVYSVYQTQGLSYFTDIFCTLVFIEKVKDKEYLLNLLNWS